MIAKFQQSIAEHVSATPPVVAPVKNGEAGKINDNSQFQNPRPQSPEAIADDGQANSQEKKEEEKEVKVDVAEEIKPIEPVEIAAPESPQVLKPEDSKIQSTQTVAGNPNAILELTKADIFKLLGMFKIPENEKKKNLDEMEETIWQDFVEEDLPLMLREDQKTSFQELLKTSPSAEKIINFFGSPPTGGLPANFEEKYLAKTLEFKAEIAKEQIETLLASNDDAEKKKILEQAKTAASNGSWKQVEDLMMNFGQKLL